MAIDNLVLGKGKVYLQARDSASPTLAFIDGERFVGNCPEINLTSETETLDHYSSTGGIRVKDKSVTLEVSRSGTFVTDNINAENVASFFLGTAGTYSQDAVAVTDEVITVYAQDRYYQIGATPSNPGGYRNISNLVVGDDATPTTTYVEGTDYSVDLATGRLYIIEGGAIASGAQQDIYLDYDKVAESRDHIISGGEEFVGAMRFVADNPEGTDKDYYMPYVKLSPNGDYSLIGDDWQQISFNLEVLKLDDNTAPIYIDGRAVA